MFDKALGCFIGLAVGDALGSTNEFKERDTYPHLTTMMGGGPFKLKPGEWTDDTSMAIALAEALVEVDGFDPSVVLRNFVDWYDCGKYSHNGKCFDIGTTTRVAIMGYRDYGRVKAETNFVFGAGNGSIMRLAPAVIKNINNREKAIRVGIDQGNTTHVHSDCVDCCEELSGILFDAIHGSPKEKLFDCTKLTDIPRHMISSSGHSKATLLAAEWCVANTSNFKDALLLAVNLGDDADTVGAVTGQIAGALYGYTSIPADWLSVLAWHDYLVDLTKRMVGEI